MSEPLVRNAADESQVKAAEVKEKLGRGRELSDLAVLLALPEGRRFIWRLLVKAGAFRSIWESSARIHYNAGSQDFGHYIIGEIEEASQEAFFQMMREVKLEKEVRPKKEK